MKKSFTKFVTALTVAGSLMLSSSTSTLAQETLYQRLGGYDAIAVVVEDFFGKLAAYKLNGRFFAETADDRKKRARQLTVDFIGILHDQVVDE